MRPCFFALQNLRKKSNTGKVQKEKEKEEIEEESFRAGDGLFYTFDMPAKGGRAAPAYEILPVLWGLIGENRRCV